MCVDQKASRTYTICIANSCLEQNSQILLSYTRSRIT